MEEFECYKINLWSVRAVTSTLNGAFGLQAYKKSEWRDPFGVALVLYYLTMAIVGLCIPDDVLKTSASAREFSDFMASIVPQIDRLTAINIKPEINRLYFSVLWAGSPVLFAIALKAIWRSRSSSKVSMWTLPPQRAIAWMAFLCLVLIGAQYAYWMTDPTNRQLRLFLASTLGRSFWGSAVFVHGTSIFSSMLVLWVFGWVTGYIPRNINNLKTSPKKAMNEHN